MKTFPNSLVCFSHLRWDFVYQRPQHLMTRFARSLSVYYVEEPIFDTTIAFYSSVKRQENVWVIVPHLPSGLSAAEVNAGLRSLVESLLKNEVADDYAFWYYTPMAYQFSASFNPSITVFDCMDELSAFKFAPAELRDMERALLDRADLVFTGGHTLYEAKKDQHENIHPFPSSIDKNHFSKARALKKDQKAAIRNVVNIGFFGVIDERFDIDLIAGIATARPEWQLHLIGPVVKIDQKSLPQLENIHYLGQRSYEKLPEHLSDWDVALIPFLLNESTRFISPTKTPEYLAAGVPVVSTPISDVVNPYGNKQLVSIAENSEEFVAAIELILQQENTAVWLEQVDAFLEGNTWNSVYKQMLYHMISAFEAKESVSIAS